MKVVVQDFLGFMNELNLKHFVEALYTQLSAEVENPNFMMSLPEILKVIVSLSDSPENGLSLLISFFFLRPKLESSINLPSMKSKKCSMQL